MADEEQQPQEEMQPKEEEAPQESGDPYPEEAAKDAVAGTQAAIEAVDASSPKPLAGLFIGSLMVLIKAAKQCDDGMDCEDYLGWAVACSTISIAICIALVVLLMLMPEFKDNTVYFVIVIVTVCMWIAGTGTMTFKKPYKNTLDNGYFGAWIALLSAMGLLSITFSTVFLEAKKKVCSNLEVMDWWFILFAGSVVAMIQSSIDCDEAPSPDLAKSSDKVFTDCEDELAWAVAASAVSVVAALLLIILSCFMEEKSAIWKYGGLFLLVWWMCGTGVSTFKDGPYKKAGNGYFSMWIALLSSAKIVSLTFFTGAGDTAEEVAEAASKAAYKKGSSYFVALLLFSLAVLIAAAIECDERDDKNIDGACKDYYGWAVACPVISICVCLFLLIVMALETFDEVTMDLVKNICTPLLLAIWIAGTYTMTFRRPFLAPSVNANGWFGAWLAGITIWTAFFELDWTPNLDQFGGWAFKMMAVGSIILGLQAAHDCDEKDCDENYLGWAVACGWAGFFVYIVFIILAKCDCMTPLIAKVFAIFFAGWYSLGMAILTYERPYLTLGNAYLGIWIATVCAFLILIQTFLA